MEKLLIVNGSPRAPKSNSKQYAAIFRAAWNAPADEYNVTAKQHEKICSQIGRYSDVLLVFPLYADGLPATLMNFLKEWQRQSPAQKPAVHVLINCGFLEPEQNFTAVEMIRLFCRKNGCRFGAALCIGSGEAILTTPFAFLVKRKIKAMVRKIRAGNTEVEKVSMPLSKKMFLSASTKYWLRLGEKNQLSREQMATMKIEGE